MCTIAKKHGQGAQQQQQWQVGEHAEMTLKHNQFLIAVLATRDGGTVCGLVLC